MTVSEAAKMRLERIKRLMSEIEYEIFRGVMDREIEPDMHYSKIFPCIGRGDMDAAMLELHLFPIGRHISAGMNKMPRLRLVEDGDNDAGQ